MLIDSGGDRQAIYDWVVDNVEYKKVGSGWGNGDTFWACSERYGNCTGISRAVYFPGALGRYSGPLRGSAFRCPVTATPATSAAITAKVQFYLPGSRLGADRCVRGGQAS